MSELSDPNVIYGGDIDESEDSIKNYTSIGAQIVSDLGLGGDKTAFVRNVYHSIACVKYKGQQPNRFDFRSMAQQVYHGTSLTFSHTAQPWQKPCMLPA